MLLVIEQFHCHGVCGASQGAEAAKKYADAQIDTLDGVTVQYPDWWFHVDTSDTEPLLRLTLEADTPELMERKLAELTPLLGEPQPHP